MLVYILQIRSQLAAVRFRSADYVIANSKTAKFYSPLITAY